MNTLPRSFNQLKLSSAHAGFTLIELVVVIVILGILAATALPKFVDLGADARIAKVNAMKAAVESTAKMAYSKCLTSSTCSPSYDWNLGQTPYITVGGQDYKMRYGYPDNGTYDFSTDPDKKGIAALMQYTGFSKVYVNDNGHTIDFTLDGAPSPDTCKVSYTEPISGTQNTPVITTTLDGCK